MGLTDFAANARQYAREDPPATAARAIGLELWTGVNRRVWRNLPSLLRTSIWYAGEWDVCLVLDACRVDALRAVASEYDWPESVGSIRSVGSMSAEWLANTQAKAPLGLLRETGHISWNGHTAHELDADRWAFVDEPWRDQWDADRGLLPPRAITDQVIRRWRGGDCKRLIAHYQQPHAPYPSLLDAGLVDPNPEGRIEEGHATGRTTVWKLLKRGCISRERAWHAYLNTLQWVLDDINRLRRNCDAEIAITADHGELFGEWGMYGHPLGVPAPDLVRVPWTTLEARDKGTYTPPPQTQSETPATATQRLQELGYV